MIKRLLAAISLSVALIWSVTAVAQGVGVVDMRQIFQASPEVKQINARLQKQFTPQRDKIIKLGKSLQDNIKKLQRNQSVMSKKDMENLRNKIQNQQEQLRAEQQQFQQELFSAQNKEMGDFMSKVTTAVKSVATKEELGLVLPKDTVLYAKNGKDITSSVISALK